MAYVALDPVEIDTSADDEERERARREAMRILAESGAAEQLDRAAVPDPGVAPPTLAEGAPPSTPPAVREQAVRAQSVGDAMRAAGRNPNPPPGIPTGSGNVRGHYYPPEPQYSDLERPAAASPQPSQPSPAPVSPLPGRGSAAPSPGAAQALSAPVNVPSPASGPADPRQAVREYVARKGGTANHRPVTSTTAPSSTRIERDPADHTGADVADAIMSPLRMLSRMARGAAGRGRPDRPGFGAASRAQAAAEDASDAQANNASAQALRAAQADQAAREGRELQREGIAQRREAAEALASTRDRNADSLASSRERANEIRQAVAEGRMSESEARMELIRSRVAAANDETDPTSAVSRQRREAFRTYIEAMPEQLRSQLGPIDPDRLEGLSAADIDQLMGGIRQASGTARHRISGRGSGAGGMRQRQAEAPGVGVAPEARGTDDDPLVAAAVAQGIDENVARDMAAQAGSSRSPRARLEQMVTSAQVRQGTRQRSRERQHRVMGYERDPDAPELSSRQRDQVRSVSTADGEFRRAVSMLERDLGNLTAAERAAGVGNLGGERYRRIEHSLEVIRTQLRSINQGGNSVAAQRMAEHSIPGLTERTTVNSILANVRAAQQVKHAYVEALMEAMGYRPEGEAGAAPRADTVRVQLPGESEPRDVLRARVDAVLERFPGAEVVQ